jgi:hypothetical protein
LYNGRRKKTMEKRKKKLEGAMEERRDRWQKGEINNIRNESPSPRRERERERERERKSDGQKEREK